MFTKEDEKSLEKEEQLVDVKLNPETEENESEDENESGPEEELTLKEAIKRINQLSRFLGKVKAKKTVYENMLKQEYEVSDNVQNLVTEALALLEKEHSEGSDRR